jgi:putative transposase
VEIPAVRPGRTRGVTSPEMSAVSDIVFGCPGTGCSPPPGPERPGQGRAEPGDPGVGVGLLVRRLADKAPGRVEKVKPQYTSQRCSACGHVDARSRESQPRFVCTACGFAGHADVNAAVNIAAGHAVTARGGDGAARPVNREPHLLLPSA